MSARPQLIHSAVLRGYAEATRSAGLDPDEQLRRVGLTAVSNLSSERLISSWAFAQLLENTARDAGMEDFGLELARGRRLSNLGPLSIVLREELTARRALDTLCRYLLVINAALVTRIEDHNDVVIIRQDLLSAEDLPVRQGIEMAVGVMFRILSELLGPQWRPLWVSFSHRKPANTARHKDLFGCRLEFNADFNGIVCATRPLSTPLPAIGTGMAPLARRFLDDALGKSRPNAADRVRRLIAVALPSGRCTADQIAQNLNMDRRTMLRHLTAEGETFSSLLQSSRRDLVTRQLRESDRTLAELADFLGFSSASSFAFWFRRQFGCSVGEWNKKGRP